MRTARWIQLIWTGLAALVINPLTVSPGLERNPFLFVAYVWLYFATAVFCFVRTWRFAWWLATVFPIGPIIYMSEFTLWNMWLVTTWQKPYRDEPFLLLPVVIIFCLTVAPGLMIYYFLFRDRHKLVGILLKRADQTSIETAR